MLIPSSLPLGGCFLDVCGTDLAQARSSLKIATQQYKKSCSFENAGGKKKIRRLPRLAIGQINT